MTSSPESDPDGPAPAGAWALAGAASRRVRSGTRQVRHALDPRLPGRRDQPVPALPTFLVIGTMKGGTSSLHRYLDSHPDISMSATKETNYLLSRVHTTRSLDWYRGQFDGRRPVRGESSPNYTKRQLFHGVPERARLLLPGVRLVYVVRDPVERATSHFLHAVHKGRRSIAEAPDALAPGPGPSLFLDTSRYHHQAAAWLTWWTPEQMLVVASEDLRDRRRETLSEIFSFLGVDPTHASETFDTVVHRTAEKFDQPPELTLEPELRDRIREYLAPDVAKLRSWTGRDFSRWSL